MFRMFGMQTDGDACAIQMPTIAYGTGSKWKGHVCAGSHTYTVKLTLSARL